MTQFTREDLATMTPTEIVEAKTAGRLNQILGIPLPHEPGATLTREDVAALYAERRFGEIANAADEGRIHYTDGDN